MADEDASTIESLRAELAQAQQRVADLEDRLRRAEHEARAQREQQRALQGRFDGFLANLPGTVWENFFAPDPEKGRAQYVSSNPEMLMGFSREEWEHPDFWLAIVHPEDREHARASTYRIVEEGRGTASYRWVTKDGRTVWVAVRMSVINDEKGAPIGIRGITMDVTDLKQAEAERNEARLRQEVLQAQQDGLLALSVPLVPIGDDLLAMTLVGKLDEARSQRVITTLLDGVSRMAARLVILDVTGVPEVDARTVDALVRAARAVSLLGAEVVVTGIQPTVARTLVDLGVDLAAIRTRSTLKAGIEYALQKSRT